MSTSATPNQVQDVIVQWHGDATDPMEIDLLDPSYLSDHYVAKMPSWLANIYTGLTERLTAIEKLVSNRQSGMLSNYYVSWLDCIISAAVGTTACDIQTGSRRQVSV
jgi:hypothetical protein